MQRLKAGFYKLLVQLKLWIKWYFKFRRANRHDPVKAAFGKQLWAFRHGFYLLTIELCEITRQNMHEYLPDKLYEEFHPYNNAYSAIIDNKLYLPFLLKDYPDLVPRYYFFIDKGRLISLDPEGDNYGGLIQLCKNEKRLVLKHCYSTYGQGFYLLEWGDGNFYLNKNLINETSLYNLIASLDNYLVTEFILQHKYSSDINSTSVNTVRLFCLWDFDRQEFFIPRSFHRFGAKGTFVDNIGGSDRAYVVFIDVPAGRTKNYGIVKMNKKKIIRSIVKNHPDSLMKIDNLEIPNWHEMIKYILLIMNRYSFLKHAGLDIVITDKGFKILEINSLPSLFLIQVEEGLLKDERIRKFYFDKMDLNARFYATH